MSITHTTKIIPNTSTDGWHEDYSAYPSWPPRHPGCTKAPQEVLSFRCSLTLENEKCFCCNDPTIIIKQLSLKEISPIRLLKCIDIHDTPYCEPSTISEIITLSSGFKLYISSREYPIAVLLKLKIQRIFSIIPTASHTSTIQRVPSISGESHQVHIMPNIVGLDDKMFDMLLSAYKFIKQGGRVLIHCHNGKSLSTVALIAFMMGHYKMSFKMAYNFIYNKRHGIEPNISGQCVLLNEWSKYLTSIN
jgi:hypothetical protein